LLEPIPEAGERFVFSCGIQDAADELRPEIDQQRTERNFGFYQKRDSEQDRSERLEARSDEHAHHAHGILTGR
jgi:hypothetical protein